MFYYIPTEDLENYRSQIPENTSQTVKGTRKIHQIFTKPIHDQKILYRQFSCLCEHCLELDFDNCVYLMASLSFSTSSHLLRPFSHDFTGNVSEDVSYKSKDEYNETEASAIVRQGDIVVVKTSDDIPVLETVVAKKNRKEIMHVVKEEIHATLCQLTLQEF